MKRLLPLLVFMLCLIIPASAKVHAAALDVLIVEVQTESLTSASEEFIKISNNSAHALDIADWHLQYFSATVVSFDTPTRNITLAGVLNPHDTFLATSSGYKTDEAQVSFGAGLAASGGHVRLVSGTGANLMLHDLVGWGTALHPENASVPVASKGNNYARKTTENGMFIDTDNNAADFDNGAEALLPLASTSEETQLNTIDQFPIITELLPDPASPATDATGEFVELYNPYSVAIDLTGLKIQTGNSYAYSYTFKSGSLAPYTYQSFYAPTTKLTLSNTSGQARLLNANGETVSETASYGKAPVGSSWMLYEDVWAWTGTPTPNAENTVATEPIAPQKTTTTKATSTKTTKPKAAAKTSTAKAKAAKTTAAAASKGDYATPASDKKTLPVNPILLAVVGVPLIGYMVYEYRHDIANFYAKHRRDRGRRSQTRPVPAGR